MTMTPKIVIASDSFKGSLTSADVALAVERGLRRILGDRCNIVRVTMADGGEGTAEALMEACGGECITAPAHDPLMRPIEARYAMLADGTAAIDVAEAGGLARLVRGERNPLTATSYGTGELISDALGRGCRRFIIGVGGSATCDGGAGLLSALGFGFFDKYGDRMAVTGGNLSGIASITPSGTDARFTVACDVSATFTGPRGAARVFAPQKGADAAAVERLEAGMERLARIAEGLTGMDIRNIPGAGAAGGIAGMMAAMLGASLRNGARTVLDAVGFDKMLEGACLVITGEGRLDAQTAMGKAPAGVLEAAAARGIPVAAICGGVEPWPGMDSLGFAGIYPIHSGPVGGETAADAELTKRKIEKTAESIIKTIKI